MTDCFYCQDGEKLRRLMILIGKTEYTRIYLNRDQKHPGRCVVQLKAHKTEYFQMTEDERNCYFRDLAATAKAIDNIYHPGKINYATFGDLVPHVHVHVVPKQVGGLQWGVPFDDGAEKVFLSDEEYKHVIDTLKKELSSILGDAFY